MDKVETTTGRESDDVVDPSTPLVTVTIAKQDSNLTALEEESIQQKSESVAPIQFRLYKRRWLGIVALVRGLLSATGAD